MKAALTNFKIPLNGMLVYNYYFIIQSLEIWVQY